MSNRRYFTEDFKIDIKATPKKVDIKADGDEAKEVEDLAKSMFGDDFDFFATFDEEDKATEEVDEPIDNGFEDEEEVEAEEITEADEDADFFDIEYDLDGKYDEDEAKAIRSKRAASELELEFDDIEDEVKELTETKKDPAYGKFDDIYDELDVTAKTGYKGGVDGKGHKVLAEPGERYDAVSEMGIGPNNTIRVFSKDPERLNFAKKVADFFGAPYEEHSIPGSKFAVDIDYMNTKVTEACKAKLDEESEIERAINNFDFGGEAELKECGPIEEKCEEKLELKEEDCDCCEKCPECEELENMSKEDLIALVKELRK